METEKLKLVLLASKSKSLSDLSRQTGICQSGISQTIKSVESILGVKMFHRGKGGISLTAEGSRLLPFIRRVTESQERLMKATRKKRPLTLRIAAFTSVATKWLPSIIRAFAKKSPDVRLDLLNGDYADIEKWASARKADVAFTVLSEGTGHADAVIPLYDDELVAAVPEDFDIPEDGYLRPKDIAGKDFITLLDASNQDFCKALGEPGRDANIKYKTKDDYQMAAMVKEGLGISVMPRLLLDQAESAGLKKVSFSPKAFRKIALKIVNDSEDARRFAEVCVEFIKSLNGSPETAIRDDDSERKAGG